MNPIRIQGFYASLSSVFKTILCSSPDTGQWSLSASAWLRHVNNHVANIKRVTNETRHFCSLYEKKIHSITWVQERYLKQDSASYSPQLKGKQVLEHLATKLAEWFECPKQQAEQMCIQIPKAKPDHLDLIEEYVQHFKKYGLPFNILIQYPWLWQLSLKPLNERIQLLTEIGITVNTVPLLQLTTRQLAKVVNKWLLDADSVQVENFQNRLEFFAHHLHCSVPDFSLMMQVHYPLLTLDWCKMSRMMQLLLSNGIPPEDIKKDLWIFRHNEEMIQGRIQRSSEAGVTHIKTWMLRCPESIFANSLEKWHNTQDVLGVHKDPVGYLAERLQCGEEEIVVLSRRYPRLLCINLPKVKQVLDFLFANGFTPEQVRNAPRVLGHSITTLQHRLQELNNLGYHPKHMRSLFCTAKDYQRLIEKLQKAKRV